jgi:hypothetical protein
LAQDRDEANTACQIVVLVDYREHSAARPGTEIKEWDTWFRANSPRPSINSPRRRSAPF